MNGLHSLAGNLRAVAQHLGDEIVVARGLAHDKFDQIWKHGRMSRTGAYKWLAQQMRLPPAQAHIKFFDVEQCRKVIRCVERNFPDFK